MGGSNSRAVQPPDYRQLNHQFVDPGGFVTDAPTLGSPRAPSTTTSAARLRCFVPVVERLYEGVVAVLADAGADAQARGDGELWGLVCAS